MAQLGLGILVSFAAAADELPVCPPQIRFVSFGTTSNGEVSGGCQGMQVETMLHLEILTTGRIGMIRVEIPEFPRNIKHTCRDPEAAIRDYAENAIRRAKFIAPAETCWHTMRFSIKQRS